MSDMYLSVETIKAAARKAYDEGRLLAQKGINRESDYYYKDLKDGTCCAIGAAFSDAHIERLPTQQQIGLSEILSRNPKWFSKYQFFEIMKIQRTHDKWGLYNGTESEFLKAIDHPKANQED